MRELCGQIPLSPPLLISAVPLSRSDQAFLLCSNDELPTGPFSFSLPVCPLFPVAGGTLLIQLRAFPGQVFPLFPLHMGRGAARGATGVTCPQCECTWGPLTSGRPCRAGKGQLCLLTFASLCLWTPGSCPSCHAAARCGSAAARLVPALPRAVLTSLGCW